MSIQVLLIDDDQEFLDVLSERLAIRGFDVTTAVSSRIALDRLKSESFDVILLDLQMPEMDGLQTLEKLTDMVPGQQIILLTAHATVAKGVQAMKLGAADVLEKPIDIRELVEKITKVATAKKPAPQSGKFFHQLFKKRTP